MTKTYPKPERMFYFCSGMSRYLDGSPKPADPIWFRQDETLHARCRCGHQASGTIGRIALQAGMGRQER